MVKFLEGEIRKFRNVFVCRKCKSKLKAPSTKVAQGIIKCRNCKSTALRAIKRK